VFKNSITVFGSLKFFGFSEVHSNILVAFAVGILIDSDNQPVSANSIAFAKNVDQISHNFTKGESLHID